MITPTLRRCNAGFLENLPPGRCFGLLTGPLHAAGDGLPEGVSGSAQQERLALIRINHHQNRLRPLEGRRRSEGA